MEKINPFREFLNIAADIYDMAEIAEDGSIYKWKSPELLELFDKFYKWNKEFGEPLVLKEDEYDYLKAKNPAIEKLAEMFGLEIES